MTSAPRRARGFTLLELVISCTILVTVFAFAATALTRVHRLRVESEAQTRLMTEGRALLDDLATQLAYAAGTNLWLETPPSSSGNGHDAGGVTLALVRYAVPPHAASPGDASRTTPYYALTLDLAPNISTHDTREAVRHGRLTDDSLTYHTVKTPGDISYATTSAGSPTTITNAYAADEMGTHLPAAAKGDTIRIPVTTGSSVTTYGTQTSYGGRLDVLPSPFEGTNTVVADVFFTNRHTGARIQTIRKPSVGAWPPPATRTRVIRAFAEIDAANLSTNAFLAPGFLDYTNHPLTTASFADAETNATARTDLAAQVAALDSALPGEDKLSSTNGLVAGELLFGPSDAPVVVSNFWTWGSATAADTNNILSGLSLVIGGRTNTYASAADVAASATSTVVRADANFQFAELLDLLTVDFDEGDGAYAVLTNFVTLAEPVAFTNVFAPSDASGAALPLYVSEVLAYDERITPVDFTAAFSAYAAAAATGTNATPLLGQSYRREIDLEIERTVTPSGMTFRVAHDWRTESRYTLLFDAPATLVATNSQIYGGATTNLVPTGTSYDTETRWHDIVLDRDIDGADERTSGIWLKEEGERDVTRLVVRTNEVDAIDQVEVADTDIPDQEHTAPSAWRALHAAVITPLCFSTNENERLSLVVWDPDDDPPGPPVCADIYLELLSEPHRRRALQITDESKQQIYIQNHVIRLSRRAPIGTARKVAY